MPSGRLMDSTHFDLRKCHDLSDLTAMLVASAVNNVFASDQPDLVGIYRWAIGIKVNMALWL
ncbi:hypothetical protein J1614_008169 [Plenodomus biglobosus]|nr:hypothetical protein J1614_008169 [Plenodomus biglobosus]